MITKELAQEFEQAIASGKTPEEIFAEIKTRTEEVKKHEENRVKREAFLNEIAWFTSQVYFGAYDGSDLKEALMRHLKINPSDYLQKEEETDIIEEIETNEE